MKKFKVALKLAQSTILELIALARLIVTKMTAAVADFPTPDPPLLDLTTAANDLETAKQDVDAAKVNLAEKVAIQTSKEEDLRDLITDEGKYVDIKAKGDKAKIESAGMPVADQGGPVGTLPQVTSLSLSRGDNPGEVDAHWNPVKKKDNYTLRKCGDINTPQWVIVSNPTKSSMTIKNLVSGEKIWVQVCANGTAGAGPYSDPAVIIVP